MAAAAGELPCQAWLWQPVQGRKAPLVRDPAALPTKYSESARAYREDVRGPRFAQLVPIQVLKTKGNAALVQEEGFDVRAVPAGLTVPWYEGLLLLAELEARPAAGGAWHRAHAAALAKERARYSNRVLSAASYVKRSLLDVAATGPDVTDAAGKQWSHRRDLQVDAPTTLEEGQDGGRMWRVREVAEYLPPWSAFCHPKCGTYQDHYLIRWAPPYSEVDYGDTETGWGEGPGATWEPDECLPLHFDGLRIAAKRRWLAAQLRREGEAAAQFKQRRAAEIATAVAEAAEGASDGEEAEEVGPQREGPPALKRRKTGEEDPEAVPLWETLVLAQDFRPYVKEARYLADFAWQTGGGSLAQQLARAIDACVREKRVAVTWAFVRAALRAANEGPLSPRTRVATEAVCDLAKAKRFQLRVLETVVGDLAKALGPKASGSVAEGACGAVAWILVHMFPMKKDAGWGWPHMGWTWSGWWDFVARLLQDFQPAHAFLALRSSLELMLAQGPPGGLVCEMPVWGDDLQRIRELRRRLCKASGLTGPELIKELDHLGIDDRRPEEPPMPKPREEIDPEA